MKAESEKKKRLKKHKKNSTQPELARLTCHSGYKIKITSSKKKATKNTKLKA